MRRLLVQGLTLLGSLAAMSTGCGSRDDFSNLPNAGTTGGKTAGGVDSEGGAIGGDESGGAPAAGGASSGGSRTGGTSTGGATTGGSPTGGSSIGGTWISGGTSTGGSVVGGTPFGGVASNTGGTSTGGAPSGGTQTGGTQTGGTRTTGGTPTGGTTTGGVPTGGTSSGGTRTGGTSTDGSATGGSPPAMCTNVTSLPEQYSSCGANNPPNGADGESRCLNGNVDQRCVCERTVWYCNTTCNSFAEPVAGASCATHRGAGCVYSGGRACACVSDLWMCIEPPSNCPATPAPGDPCPGQLGKICDYPGAPHLGCVCVPPESDAGAEPTWNSVISGSCPRTQPVYPTACTSVKLCTYGNVNCVCLNGGVWLCV